MLSSNQFPISHELIGVGLVGQPEDLPHKQVGSVDLRPAQHWIRDKHYVGTRNPKLLVLVEWDRHGLERHRLQRRLRTQQRQRLCCQVRTTVCPETVEFRQVELPYAGVGDPCSGKIQRTQAMTL